MIKLIGRFIRAFRFYAGCVGLRNALFVELPEFIAQAKENHVEGYSFLSDLVDCMEDCEEDYRQCM